MSDIRRVHREYSWRPQLHEAKRAGHRRRKACMGMGWRWAVAYGVHGWGISCTACCCYLSVYAWPNSGKCCSLFLING